jgi:hypothetical protein
MNDFPHDRRHRMTHKQYLERLKQAIFRLHKVGAMWLGSVPVHEVSEGRTVWKGTVEVFELPHHPTAKRCYGWSHPEGPDDQGERFVMVLEIPPVESAVTAVRASMVAEAKAKK